MKLACFLWSHSYDYELPDGSGGIVLICTKCGKRLEVRKPYRHKATT